MQQIVSYLNGKGGILLIGVQKVNNQILPIV
jgi:predicted HTH transcriptional regulator